MSRKCSNVECREHSTTTEHGPSPSRVGRRRGARASLRRVGDCTRLTHRPHSSKAARPSQTGPGAGVCCGGAAAAGRDGGARSAASLVVGAHVASSSHSDRIARSRAPYRDALAAGARRRSVGAGRCWSAGCGGGARSAYGRRVRRPPARSKRLSHWTGSVAAAQEAARWLRRLFANTA